MKTWKDGKQNKCTLLVWTYFRIDAVNSTVNCTILHLKFFFNFFFSLLKWTVKNFIWLYLVERMAQVYFSPTTACTQRNFYHSYFCCPLRKKYWMKSLHWHIVNSVMNCAVWKSAFRSTGCTSLFLSHLEKGF